MKNKVLSTKQTILFLSISIVILLLFSAFSLFSYRITLNKCLYEKIQDDLEWDTDQSIYLFQNIIQNYFTQLDTIREFCSLEITHHNDIMDILKKNSVQKVTQYGIIDENGILYTDEKTTENVSDEEYFQKAMQGIRGIYGVMQNKETGEDFLVFSAPIYLENNIVGVVYMKYDVHTFTAIFSNSQYQDFGATMIIQTDGRMVSSYEGMEEFHTFYEALETMEFRGDDTLEKLKKRIQNGESGFFTYYNNGGQGRYLYFRPTGIRDFVMISLVLAESMEEQFYQISKQAFLLTIKNVFYYCIILICSWKISILFQRHLRNSQMDLFTNTYNKTSAKHLMEQILQGKGKDKKQVCFFIDIDDFKNINDQYGHNIGDEMIKNFANKLKKAFRDSDIICRFGGDEFVVWMKNIPPEEEIERKKADHLCRILTCSNGIPVSASIGIACYPKDGTSYEEVLHHADEALYHAKNSGKNKYVFYSDLAK